MDIVMDPQVIEILYTNQQGDLAKLSIRPSKISFGKIPFFENEQWLLHAHNVELNADQIFPLKDIQAWLPHRLQFSHF